MLRLTSSEDAVALPKRLIWGPQEEAAAKEQIDLLLSRGFVIKQCIEGECLLDPPSPPDDLVCIRILDDTGDTRLVWNRKKIEEISEAREKFNAYLKKGYRAYACRRDGEKGAKVDSFDALQEELIFVKECGSSPAKKVIAQGILVPPTTPG